MAFHIKMFKEDKSPGGVRYRAEMTVAVDPYVGKNGRQRYHLAKAVAVFELQLASQELAFLTERSDAVFLDGHAHRMRCLVKMRECLRAGRFPETVEWAS